MLYQKTFLATLLAIALTACGGGSGGNDNNTGDTINLQGSVGDGPIVSATVAITRIDSTPVATITSDDRANYSVELHADTAFPLLIAATGGTDTVTGQPPTFTLYSVVLDASENTANINPFTTLIVKTAQAMPGGLNTENLAAAKDIVLAKLNFGLDTRLAADPIIAPVSTANVANIVKASEALAEMIRRTRSTLADAGTVLTEDELLAAVGGDLSDGLLDGNGPGADVRTAATAHIVSADVILELLENALQVNGAPATTQLDAAIRLTLPDATQTTSDVVITASLLTQARQALNAARALAPQNSGLSALAAALDGIGANSLPGDITLPADAGTALELAIASLAGATPIELNAVIETITVDSNNTPPTISGTPPTNVTAGGTYSFAPSVSDADGDTLAFSISNEPAWATFNTSTGSLTGTPSADDIGFTSGIVISVSDGTTVVALPAFNITVTDTNGDTPLSITNTSIPAYQWDTLEAGKTVFTDRNYVYTELPSRLSGLPVLRTANDDKGATGDNFLRFDVNLPVTVHIAYDSRIPALPSWLSSWTATGEQIIDSDTTRNLYRADFPAGTVTLGGNAGGGYSMYTVIVDGGTTSGGSNNPPTISGTPAGNAVVGANYSFTPSANDVDGDMLTFSISNKPAWASFNTATGTLSGTPTTGDTGTTSGIVISVSDGMLSSALPAFSITVSDSASGTASISWIPPTTNEDGSTLTDLAGYKIHYGTTLGNYPNTIDIANTGITSYIVNNLPTGTHYFVVTAYDTSGNESTYSNVASKTIP